jgi:hypothetical protein
MLRVASFDDHLTDDPLGVKEDETTKKNWRKSDGYLHFPVSIRSILRNSELVDVTLQCLEAHLEKLNTAM